MCGIAGIFSTDPVPEELVAKMLDAISYRGPDHQGVRQYRSERGGFLTVGQARLAIVDLSPEANQPFESACGTHQLSFNGECYNFRELREACRSGGVAFRTQSDTEVVLHSLDRWGEAALPKLWGMFAGAWYRQDTGELLLFRDRMGQKPLYLYREQGRLYFASEPKAILAALDHTPEPDDEAIAEYFYLGYIPSDRCIYKGRWQLPAGALARVNPQLEFQTETWYRPEAEAVDPTLSLESLFFDAVEKRMVADVPLAAFLSGGLDSSLVVAAMARVSTKPVNTFCVRFDGPQVLDESAYAREVAQHCGTTHHEIVLDMKALREALPEVLDHFDEPFGDSSAVPMFLVSRAARQQFTVALSGDGADEVFAGYRKYLGEHYLRRLGPYGLRRRLWRPLTSRLPSGQRNRLLETGRRVRRLLKGDAPNAAERHVNWLHMVPIDDTPILGPRLAGMGFDPVRQRLIARLPANANLNDVLAFDQELVLRDDMFVKVDRMSMKASLEVRSPMIDHRLVHFANRLAPAQKLQGTLRKRVLIEKLGHLLPTSILKRPKTGFEMPLGAWLATDLASWAEDGLFARAQTQPWVNHERLREAWKLHCSGRMDCTVLIWSHIVFANWLDRTYA